jgi:hypothetical protein
MIRKEYLVVVTAAAVSYDQKTRARNDMADNIYCQPFKDNETNPTQQVKAKLPDRIEREGRIPIKIIKYPVDFRNVFTDMDIIPKLWNRDRGVYDPDSKEGDQIYIDAILHLGMNFSDIWRVEERAHRDGYDWVGDDGVPLPKHNGGEGGRFEGLPEVLRTMFDVDDIVRRLHEELPVCIDFL